MEIKQTKVIDKKIIDAMFSYYLKNDKRLKMLKIVFPVFAVFAIAFSIFNIYYFGIDVTTIIIFIFGIFFLLYPFVVYPLLLKKNYKKASRITLGQKSTIELNNSCIKITLENETSEYTWSAIIFASDIGDYLMLNANNSRSLILKKDKLSEEEIQWVLSYKERI